MLTPTSAIMGAGLGDDVALMTDGRFSGGSHGFIVGHITPEAQEGGPLALVEDGGERGRAGGGRHIYGRGGFFRCVKNERFVSVGRSSGVRDVSCLVLFCSIF